MSSETKDPEASLQRLDTAPSRPEEQPVHSVFTKHQKWYIVFCASCAGFISFLPGQVYFPALNSLAHDLKPRFLARIVTDDDKIFQGLSPMFLGDFADRFGRRPAYAVCFLLYMAASIGLALQSNYAALFVLRCLQSAGIGPAMALSVGVISDIATAAERGSYMGLMTGGTVLGPSVGPIIGGLLTQYLGWRAIFWFLTIFGGTFVIQMLLFFPETARKIVGNGSISPQRWNQTVLSWYQTTKGKTQYTSQTSRARSKLGFPNPSKTLVIMFQKEAGIIIFSNAIFSLSYYVACACIPAAYQKLYGLNSLQVGLCYLPLGFGAMVACIGTGKMLDSNYRRLAKRLNLPVSNAHTRNFTGFPIEKARLLPVFPLMAVGGLAVIAFGWVLDFRVHLAVPTVMLFLLGATTTAANSIFSTLLVDLNPRAASAAAASRHFVRCLLGAGATAALEPMVSSMGYGWCFTLVALVTLAPVPFLWTAIRLGPRWRAQRSS
ncbi:conserved hypothetical protein [Aspergillus terreus NIH2624]|uniref:Major facilitator superfamily (MFS) profile domain-containing protein n=1 Tax=Aspergillus terreus (strain NIH 2624 / FGSC A1156) TaxID=341663 RepID=Q0CBJ0_ASPTN|nr:uncharacterized protein ATEG_08944 [Aspergillus terreus NIH2624]EAU31076.1 conserved hypothetical protein [Aspergillus terreus NIH2624]